MDRKRSLDQVRGSGRRSWLVLADATMATNPETGHKIRVQGGVWVDDKTGVALG